MTDHDNPDWTPLRKVIPAADLDYWMWMGRSSADDGTTIEQYKHRQTRGYLNLSTDGQAWLIRGNADGCTPFCGETHEHRPDSPPTVEAVSMETAREWAWI
ncbi:hypothetical protein ABZ671_00490 [Micromonospora sp. NPDC006766]|uniref:hypothetical protein n=1 Tax=Micromonospora sp. NPDC006766 TaxID=3154778 RepID=UPI0033E11692